MSHRLCVAEILSFRPDEPLSFAGAGVSREEFFGGLALMWWENERLKDKAIGPALIAAWLEHCERTGEDSKEVSGEFVQAFKRIWEQRAVADGGVAVGGRKASAVRGVVTDLLGQAVDAKPKRSRKRA